MKIIPQDEEGKAREVMNLRKVNTTIPDDWSYSIVLYEINCKDRTFKILQLTTYNAKNEILYTTPIEHPRLGYISPETMTEKLFKNVCVRKD